MNASASTPAMPLNNIHIRFIGTYVHPDTGVTIHISQHGRLVPKALVQAHQRRDNTRNYDSSIPCWGLHTARMEDDEPTPIKPLEWGFMHPSTNHHGARLTQCEWEVLVNGEVYKMYDRKRNYERRVRDLVNVCEKILKDWKD